MVEGNKFKIGSQWKTRGGWRAVIVGQDGSACPVNVWHSDSDRTECHFSSGALELTSDNASDLMEPWTEPEKGTVWVNIYDDGSVVHTSRPDADEGSNSARLACVKVDWLEGEGLEQNN